MTMWKGLIRFDVEPTGSSLTLSTLPLYWQNAWKLDVIISLL